MDNRDFIEILISPAKAYQPISEDSVKRNSHMNEVDGKPINQDLIDAVVVDFINYVGGQ